MVDVAEAMATAVGDTGFEPATSRSRTVRASQLRQSPPTLLLLRKISLRLRLMVVIVLYQW